MIDLLDSVTADLESGHLDDAETVCSVALKIVPDVPWAALACARQERAHAPEYLTRVQNPDLAHLHVEIAVAQGGLDTYGSAVSTAPRALVFGPKASEPLSNACQRCFPWKQLLQSADTQVRLEPNKDIDVAIEARASTMCARPTARFKSRERAPANVQRVTELMLVKEPTMTPVSIEVAAPRCPTVRSVLATLPLFATDVDHRPSRSV